MEENFFCGNGASCSGDDEDSNVSNSETGHNYKGNGHEQQLQNDQGYPKSDSRQGSAGYGGGPKYGGGRRGFHGGRRNSEESRSNWISAPLAPRFERKAAAAAAAANGDNGGYMQERMQAKTAKFKDCLFEVHLIVALL